MLNGWFTSLFTGLTDLLETEGRHLREQMVRVILAIMVTCAAMVLGLMSILVALAAGYMTLREQGGFPPAAAMGTVALAMLVVAGVMALVGRAMRKAKDPPDEAASAKSAPNDHAPAMPESRPSGAGRASMHALTPDQASTPPASHAGQGQSGSLTEAILAAASGQTSPMALVRDHPVATAGTAFAVGLLVTRFGLGRSLLKTGAVWAIRQAILSR